MLQKLLRKKTVCIRQLFILFLVLALTGLVPASDFACAHLIENNPSSCTDNVFLYRDRKMPEDSHTTWKDLCSTPETKATITEAMMTTPEAIVTTPEAIVTMPEVLITTPEIPITLSVGKQQSLYIGRFFSNFQNTLRKVRTPVRLLSLPLLSHLFSIFMSLCFLLFSVFMLQVKQRLSIILYIHHQDGQKGLSVLS
ncbi:MAG: hypothetical protein PUD77_05130 [Clostridiales bacterium]|nr:hypothetical protein [Clostridiales bacterium]